MLDVGVPISRSSFFEMMGQQSAAASAPASAAAPASSTGARQAQFQPTAFEDRGARSRAYQAAASSVLDAKSGLPEQVRLHKGVEVVW